MFGNAIVLLTSAVIAAAHGGVIGYEINSQWQKGFIAYNPAAGQTTIQRQWETYNPLLSVNDPDFACNIPGTTVSPQLTATTPAGSSITAYWNTPWPHAIGPMMVYMANCGGSCSSANPASLNWFKINESGLLSGTVTDGFWGNGQMIAQNSSWTVTIPKSLPTGQYMLRHETLAIHTANQPQFYMQCAQLQVTGGGNGTPGPTVKFPGAYNQNDPSINIDVYTSTATTYKIPGPAVWSG